MKRSLYFDIDGTLLDIDTGEAKKALACGAFERLVRQCGLDRLVCVGNFVDVIRVAGEYDSGYDGMGTLYRLCNGVFTDEAWFRNNVCLVNDASNRAEEVDFAEDWWYVDDLAAYYFERASLSSEFSAHVGNRILVPIPNGDGEEVVSWLEEISK